MGVGACVEVCVWKVEGGRGKGEGVNVGERVTYFTLKFFKTYHLNHHHHTTRCEVKTRENTRKEKRGVHSLHTNTL